VLGAVHVVVSEERLTLFTFSRSSLTSV
jgi:hypothetical protein